jgi:hypothetical protein
VRHAREVGPDGRSRDVLAEPDGERARGRGQVVEDVAERDEVRREVRTSTPTACLPGIGARMRISVVASAYERSSFSAATFDTFVPGASCSS